MTDRTERIILLLSKRLIEPLSDDEENELHEWIGDNPERLRLADRLSDMKSLAEAYRKRSLINPECARREMHRRIDEYQSGRRRLINALWLAVSVAAIFALVWMAIPSEQLPDSVASRQPVVATLSIDSLGPGESIAFIMEEGKRIAVSSNEDLQETISQNGGQRGKSLCPLTLEVPRGGEFIIVLEDSTRVWLNSESSLSYPENFDKTERRVKISGEAYFDVVKDDSRPFFVECEGQEIQVYGTEFNVRAYPEDESVFTSLSEGSIALRRLDDTGGELFLSPGKQAVFNKTTRQAEVKSVNIETVTGWRHGRFVFENQTLLQIMHDLSRWYDFEFEFSDKGLEEIIFMGSIPRYGNFSTAMLILEKSGNVTFESDGDKIIVSRKSSL